MRKLYIYTGITPNQDNGKHYMFNSVALYMQALQQHLLTTVDLNNYRINSNVAKLGLSSLLTQENYDTVTYLIDYDEVTKYFRCYTVLRATLDSNITYALEVDLWATFIKDCDFSKVHITRCNRQLNEYGIYDEPQSTEQNFTFTPVAPTQSSWLSSDKVFADINSIYIVVLIQYNSAQAVFGSDKISTTKLVARRLGDFNEIATVLDTDLIAAAIQVIGGIYKVNGSDAQVIEAYLLPSLLISVSLFDKIKATYKISLFEDDPATATGDFDLYEVEPSRNLNLVFENLPTNPNYIYYFGTINGGIKLKKYTKNTDGITAYIRSFIGKTTVKIIALQGEEQKDITEDFKITLTTSASVTTSIRELTSILPSVINDITNVAKETKKGDLLSAGAYGVNSIISQFDTKKGFNKAIGSGDATVIYYTGSSGNYSLYNPFVVTKYLSVNDANKHANMYGATFDYFASNGNAVTVFDFDSTTLLGNGDITDTYIIASCDIDGVPLEAHNEIGRKLSAGIYYTVLK